ncbi:MAG: PLP-dependent transferase, partial [Clostridia bacterium]|nr:PLP-dependent transferase [Clostridia bacterium]
MRRVRALFSGDIIGTLPAHRLRHSVRGEHNAVLPPDLVDDFHLNDGVLQIFVVVQTLSAQTCEFRQLIDHIIVRRRVRNLFRNRAGIAEIGTALVVNDLHIMRHRDLADRQRRVLTDKLVGCHGFRDFGIRQLRFHVAVVQKDMTGAFMPANEAYLVARGLKTLEIRMQRHCDNAMKIARYLKTCDKVEKVYYPGLEDHEGHEIAKRQ